MNRTKGILRAIRALNIPFSIFMEVIKMIKLYPKEQLEKLEKTHDKSR